MSFAVLMKAVVFNKTITPGAHFIVFVLEATSGHKVNVCQGTG